MRTIAVMNPMGGSGKTYTAFALCAGLSRRGYKVLCVDADWQGGISVMSGVEPEMRESFWREFLKGEELPGQLPAVKDGFSVIQCNRAQLKRCDRAVDIAVLRDALREVEGQYDYCVIDAPPDTSTWSVGIMLAAQMLILPLAAHMMGMYQMERFEELLQSVLENGNPNLSVAVLPVMQGEESPGVQLSELIKNPNTKIFRTEIRYDALYVKEARRRHSHVFEMFPDTVVPMDYDRFVGEFVAMENNL